jgi:hypothetical protein
MTDDLSELATMDRATLVARLDAKVAALREEQAYHDSKSIEIGDRIDRLEAIRDDPDDIQDLLDVIQTPAPSENDSASGFFTLERIESEFVKVLTTNEQPKSRQYARVRRYFLNNDNEWATAAEIAAGSRVVVHSVRQMMYQRYTDLFERREEEGPVQFRLKVEDAVRLQTRKPK